MAAKGWWALALLIAAGGVAEAQQKRAGDKVERKRQEILDKLGLDRAPSQPQAPKKTADEKAGDESSEPSVGTEGDGPEPTPDGPTPEATGLPQPAAAKAPPSYRRQIHPWLKSSCHACHQSGGPAGFTPFLLTGDATRDHAIISRFINTRAPARSAAVSEASGRDHGGGTIAAANTPAMRRLVAWIGAGAPLEDVAARDVAAADAPAPPSAPPSKPPRVRRKTPPSPPVSSAAATEATPATETTAEAATATEKPAPSLTSTPSADRPAASAYGEGAHAVLMQHCASCHSERGMAARSRLRLTNEVAADFTTVSGFVKAGQSAQSPLLMKASGQQHMPVLGKTADGYRTLAVWIDGGAHGPFPPPPGATDEPTNASDESAFVPAPATAAAPGTVAPPVPPPASHGSYPGHGPHGGGLPLMYGLRLNGRFDMAFERRGLHESPFSSGQTQFQNYHHFLFLSRDGGDDPVTFTVEMVALTFWEAQIRVTPKEAPTEVRVKLGKLIVPFGAEPLFHQSYGGLQGFDQRVLPVFWAQHGFGARLTRQLREVSLMADVYAIRGYGLREEQGVLNLQNDFSPNDDVRPAYGARLNLSWRALSGYYSLLVNGLGFGRTLTLQALDVSTWRWHGVPLLERLTLGLGFLRADVSGGGAGNDYYHFASYYQARFYFTDGIYLQYRQGLRTFNNRRGFFQDDTRWTPEDASAHNLGLVWRRRGLSIGIFQFWNLEKASEVRDDFFRLLVAYEF